MKPQNWKWFGHAGHLICARSCQFHLCTLVGKYLVSTVGEYWPERAVREIHARCHDPKWLADNQRLKGDAFDRAYMQKFGFETVGCDRKYETYVFKAGEPCKAKDCNCGLPALADCSELDALPANDAGTATANHMKTLREMGQQMIPQKWQKFRPIPENDVKLTFNPDLGPVWACVESGCRGLVLHAHCQRPYICRKNPKKTPAWPNGAA